MGIAICFAPIEATKDVYKRQDPCYPISFTPNTTIAAVILSVSGETKQVLHLARQRKEKNAGLIAITCSDQSSAAKLSDITLPYYLSLIHI